EGVCSSALPARPPRNPVDRPWFQRALASRGFAVGDYQIGRVTGKPSLGFAMPMLAEDGRVEEIIYAALDLAYLDRAINSAKLPAGATFTLIDRNGTVLARQPDPQAWVGKSIMQSELYRTIQRHGPGDFEAMGLDGVPRLFYALEVDAGHGVYAAIG